MSLAGAPLAAWGFRIRDQGLEIRRAPGGIAIEAWLASSSETPRARDTVV